VNHTVDPRTLLSADLLAAARANVDAAPPLSPQQVDFIADLFRPYVRRTLAEQHQAS
jgi:hypothetical protein